MARKLKGKKTYVSILRPLDHGGSWQEKPLGIMWHSIFILKVRHGRSKERLPEGLWEPVFSKRDENWASGLLPGSFSTTA